MNGAKTRAEGKVGALARSVTIYGKPIGYTEDACDAAARRLGLPGLPQSYCEYVEVFGYGEWKDDLSISVPCDPKLTGSLDEGVDSDRSLFEFWKTKERAKGVDRYPYLLSFADTTMGFSFAWDASTRKPSGEMDIYMIAFPEILDYCCGDFYEFVADYWIGGKINTVYIFEGGEKWQTGPEFRVKKPVPPYGATDAEGDQK